MTKTIKINRQDFTMHVSGAMYWEQEASLLISDVHLGKISHFRKYGNAIPQKAIAGNFRKLDEVVEYFAPEKIYFLGDLFHSVMNQEWQFFKDWVDHVFPKITLVLGNHDIISPLRYEALGIKVISEKIADEFLFTHHPEERNGYFNFSGHLHPGVKLKGIGKQQLKLPCFFKNKNQLILPAFGEFTGKHIISPQQGSEIYVIAGEKIFLLTLP